MHPCLVFKLFFVVLKFTYFCSICMGILPACVFTMSMSSGLRDQRDLVLELQFTVLCVVYGRLY